MKNHDFILATIFPWFTYFPFPWGADSHCESVIFSCTSSLQALQSNWFWHKTLNVSNSFWCILIKAPACSVVLKDKGNDVSEFLIDIKIWLYIWIIFCELWSIPSFSQYIKMFSKIKIPTWLKVLKKHLLPYKLQTDNCS